MPEVFTLPDPVREARRSIRICEHIGFSRVTAARIVLDVCRQTILQLRASSVTDTLWVWQVGQEAERIYRAAGGANAAVTKE